MTTPPTAENRWGNDHRSPSELVELAKSNLLLAHGFMQYAAEDFTDSDEAGRIRDAIWDLIERIDRGVVA